MSIYILSNECLCDIFVYYYIVWYGISNMFIAIFIGMIVMYISMHMFLPVMLLNKKLIIPSVQKISFRTLFIFCMLAPVFYFTGNMKNGEIANRLLHSIGGGVLAFFIYYFAMTDSNTKVKALQFFTLGVLIVSALGVVNELFELFAATYFHMEFSTNRLDTWLDLLSNTVGLTASGAFLTLLYKSKMRIK